MFYCNNLNLLTFTYYFKIILGFGMTIIPFILLEIITIKFIRYKQKYNKFNKLFIKKQIKSIFYVICIFTLTFTLHSVIKKDDNKCYMYAKKEIVTEYKEAYQEVENANITESVKNQFLKDVLVTAYDNYNNHETKKPQTLLNQNSNDQEKKNNVETINNKVKEEDNFLNETDYNKQNNIYVVNGNYFIPSNILSGMSCPSNPLNEGYNNPYGYNNHFYIRLTKFIEEANKNGYKITMSTQGCRTYQTQVNYYNTMTRGRAANPGYSLHGFGIASDLEFYQNNGQVCPYGRTDDSCPSMGWAHAHAKDFGLNFALLYASYREDWHVEPIMQTRY